MVAPPGPTPEESAPLGVLLVNLGSPAAPHPAAVRSYLAEFLGDPHVVDWPRWLWLPILQGILLRSRPRRSAALYARIWTSEGSPLVQITRRQASALQARLGARWVVATAMRYGHPSLRQGLAALADQACRHIVLLPLFPQGARATTGSVVDAVTSLRAQHPDSLELTVVPPFPTDPGYIAALASSLRAAQAGAPAAGHVVLSFHGLPRRLGHDYAQQCQATAEALAASLAWTPGSWSLAYQSRFGPERWLGPATIDLVTSLARHHPHLLVACPGFVADCLETLEEIRGDLARRFRAAGGQRLHVVPCLNDHPEWVTALAALVRRTGAAGP